MKKLIFGCAMTLCFALTSFSSAPLVTSPSLVTTVKCCKTCTKGKACGDTCIAKDKTCHKGKGCACNG